MPSSHPDQVNGFVADLAVSAIRTLPGEHQVFNLEVEGVHEYVANGILVHNCLFPGGRFKDQVDASSGAFGRLLSVRGRPAEDTEPRKPRLNLGRAVQSRAWMG